MNNVLAIDNFSRLHGLPADTSWLRAAYTFFNEFTEQSYAQPATVIGLDNHSALYLAGRSPEPANWYIGQALPNDLDAYTLGLRIIGKPDYSHISASIGIIANASASGYDLVLAVELTPNGAILHYKDNTGPKTQTVDFTYTATTYLDFTFHKVSNTPNDMSRLMVMANNFPAFIGNVFNNVGQNLSVVFAGVLPVEPDASEGYLRHTSIADVAPTNLEYTITDMYVTKGGNRFGMPVVTSENLLEATGSGIVSSDPELGLAEVLESGPQPWSFGIGSGSIDTTFSSTVAEATQVRAIAQTQGGTTPVELLVGVDTSSVAIQDTPTMVTVISEGSPDRVVLEIGNE